MKLPLIGEIGGKKQPDPKAEAAYFAALNQATNRTDDDVAWKEQQGTNYELIHDDPIESVLNDMMYKWQPFFNEQSGKWEMLRTGYDLNMVGLRQVASHVNRCSFNDRRDIEILKPKMRAMTKLVKMQMQPDTFTLGMSTFIAGFEYATEIGLNDSVDGRKPKLLKTIPKLTSVEVQTGEIKQKPGMMR